MIRPARLLAVARYELRSHNAGKQGRRFLLLALALLLPAGLIPSPLSNVGTAGRRHAPAAPVSSKPIAVRGMVPAALQGRLELSPLGEAEIVAEAPVRVRAPDVPDDLRAVLETLPGDSRVEVRRYRPPVRLPGRSILIAIVAISLLTGPLAEALPGERARRTLEVLLSAGISRAELIGGKWLTWTAWATLTALVAAATSIFSGVQQAGLWLLGLPMFIGCAVALGMWLVRLVDDVVGGAAAPMRVLPAAASVMAGLAWSFHSISPALSALVPLGGPLLVAADMLDRGVDVMAAGAGTALFTSWLLVRTGADLDRFDAAGSVRRHGAIGLASVATILWWLAVAGPAVWILAGNPQATAPLATSHLAGGAALLGCALLACAREGRLPWSRIDARGAFVALAVGVLLGMAGPLVMRIAAPPAWAQPLAERLLSAAVPDFTAAPMSALVAILGQTWLYRFVLAPRSGWLLATLLWAIAVSPFDPLSALPASLALGLIARRHGAGAAALAHLAWMVTVAWMPLSQTAAVVIAAQLAAVALSAWRSSSTTTSEIRQ
ncbi:MAG TPA: ABC transporter permease subunit [Candidatus Limnocylindrales bacterium]|nr:ABC transporter permease subunit [Candidatus Limnocylindrales bacterium]